MAQVVVRQQKLGVTGDGVALARRRDGTGSLGEHQFLTVLGHGDVYHRPARPAALENLLGQRILQHALDGTAQGARTEGGVSALLGHEALGGVVQVDGHVLGDHALAQLGLTRAEANEFIIYWLPQMEQNAYNLISFQSDAYTDAAKLTITPQPDTLLRVFMAWKPLTSAVEIVPQTLTAPERTGFTAVEWGGAKVQ